MDYLAEHRKRVRVASRHLSVLGGMMFFALALVTGVVTNVIVELLKSIGVDLPLWIVGPVVPMLYLMLPAFLVVRWQPWLLSMVVGRLVTRSRGGAVCPLCTYAWDQDDTRCPQCGQRQPRRREQSAPSAEETEPAPSGSNPSPRRLRRAAILREAAVLRFGAWGAGAVCLVFLSSFGGNTFSFAGVDVEMTLAVGPTVDRIAGWSVVVAIICGPPLLVSWGLRRWLVRFVAARWYVLTTRDGDCPLCGYDGPEHLRNCPECGLRRRRDSALGHLADAVDVGVRPRRIGK